MVVPSCRTVRLEVDLRQHEPPVEADPAEKPEPVGPSAMEEVGEVVLDVLIIIGRTVLGLTLIALEVALRLAF